jgi:hypothetical protein
MWMSRSKNRSAYLKVVWARKGRKGRNAAQLSFTSSYVGVINPLYGVT